MRADVTKVMISLHKRHLFFIYPKRYTKNTLTHFLSSVNSPLILFPASIKCSRSLKPTILACLDALVSKRDLRQCITVTETLLSLAKDPDLKFVVFPYLYNIVIRVDVNKLAK
jgi:hypothetical protein